MKRKGSGTLPGNATGCKCGACSECVKDNVEKAFVFRDAIISAFGWEKTSKLEALVRQLINFAPTALALTQTGLGRLLFDSDLWKKMDDPSLSMLASVKSKWKASADHTCEGECWHYSNELCIGASESQILLRISSCLAGVAYCGGY